MGGLICRSLVQRVIPDDPDHGGTLDAGTRFVERIFTYATPHGGIEFAVGFGLIERLRDLTGLGGADIFGPERMYEYLTPEMAGNPPRDEFRAREMPADGFPVERLFCLVGTNPEDYASARGLSSKIVGAQSDGLVQIDNAYVVGAHRAIVHRSHSGRYGIVNSEEGYQNLRRFLFGTLEVRVDLVDLDVAGTERDDIVWQLETGLAIRGLPVLVHEQSTAHYCPIQIERRPREDVADRPVPLLVTFLSTAATRPLDPETLRPSSTLRQALRLRLLSVEQRDGLFSFLDHLEQTEDWQDTLIIDIAPGDQGHIPQAWATWNSTIPGALRSWIPSPEQKLVDHEGQPERWVGSVPLPRLAHPLLGDRARVQLTVTPR